jgi:hypothetical protein
VDDEEMERMTSMKGPFRVTNERVSWRHTEASSGSGIRYHRASLSSSFGLPSWLGREEEMNEIAGIADHSKNRKTTQRIDDRGLSVIVETNQSEEGIRINLEITTPAIEARVA